MEDKKIGLITVTSEEDGKRICDALAENGLGTTSYSYPKNEGKIEVVLPNSDREFYQVTMPRIEMFDITDKTYETKYIPSSNVKLVLSDDGKYIIVQYEAELRGRIIKTDEIINEYLGMDENKLEKCWLYDGCPCHTGSCYGLPDEGCPVYRWFKEIIEKKK